MRGRGHFNAQTRNDSDTIWAKPNSDAGNALTLKEAWGNIPILSLPTDIGNNQALVFEQAATPDGQWLVGSIVPRDFEQNATQPSYLALYNIHTRQIERIHALLAPKSQVLGASIDDHWIAWSEADDQPTFFDWTIFLYNRDSGQTRELALASSRFSRSHSPRQQYATTPI